MATPAAGTIRMAYLPQVAVVPLLDPGSSPGQRKGYWCPSAWPGIAALIPWDSDAGYVCPLECKGYWVIRAWFLLQDSGVEGFILRLSNVQQLGGGLRAPTVLYHLLGVCFSPGALTPCLEVLDSMKSSSPLCSHWLIHCKLFNRVSNDIPCLCFQFICLCQCWYLSW